MSSCILISTERDLGTVAMPNVKWRKRRVTLIDTSAEIGGRGRVAVPVHLYFTISTANKTRPLANMIGGKENNNSKGCIKTTVWI